VVRRLGSVRVQTLLSGFILTLIVRLLSITILSVLPIFMRDALHVSDLDLGVYIILVWVGNAGGTGLAVLVVKRPALASLLGLALILISMIGIPIAGVGSDPLLLGTFTVLSGVGMGLPQPFLAPLMYLSSGADQPFSGLGLYSVALAIGLIVGPFLSSLSLSAGGFPLMFGVLATVAAVGVAQVLLRNFLLRGRQFRVNPSEHRAYNFSVRQWLHALGSMKFRNAFALNFLYSMLFPIFASYGGVYSEARYGLTPSYVLLVYTVCYVASAVTRLYVTRSIRRLEVLLLPSVLALIASFLLMGLAGTSTVFVVGVLVFSVPQSLILPITTYYALKSVDQEEIMNASYAFQVSSGIADFIAPSLASAIIWLFGISNLFLVMSPIAIVALWWSVESDFGRRGIGPSRTQPPPSQAPVSSV
jgi:predicted MFS family arabinose efflux permease